ncbi:suppressor of fused domain protein [Sessilibacter corallicola]|uniref:suppressor of fused domain protein n=1 Tax=Sessilibacter corallicola TaxID=2904075 RepID=UPI001E50C2EA|nr:suppressor of fused domain protein [Sessilibacter corallicola]MCE2029376.1 suppressor of fused domain protein [Sessilibacter corallicola]
MNLSEYKQRYNKDDSTPGWDVIDSQLGLLYQEQKPKHWGTVIGYQLGGPDPLDGISAYESESGGAAHLHFCSYGFTSLYYDEEAVGGEFSRFGFELTFRLASALPPAEEPIWVCSLLQNLARYVFESGKWFEEYHWIPANGPIRADYDTDIVGLVFVKDPELKTVASPHGKVEFLQMFGITQVELDDIMNSKRTCKEVVESHRKTNPYFVTDLSRKSE